MHIGRVTQSRSKFATTKVDEGLVGSSLALLEEVVDMFVVMHVRELLGVQEGYLFDKLQLFLAMLNMVMMMEIKRMKTLTMPQLIHLLIVIMWTTMMIQQRNPQMKKYNRKLHGDNLLLFFTYLFEFNEPITMSMKKV